MKWCFIYQDEKLHKFWNIEQVGNKLITNYGRLGTEGQIKEKAFKTEEECIRKITYRI